MSPKEPKGVKIGWADKNSRNWGHSEDMTREEAERIKNLLKQEYGDKKVVVIYPPADESEEDDA